MTLAPAPAAPAATAGATPSVPPRAALCTGVVRHRRMRPQAHAFEYPTAFLLLPLRTLRAQPDPALRRNGFGLMSFNDRDHGNGGNDALAWLDALLWQEGVWQTPEDPGEVWLQTYPRVLGFVFKPVSFWHCHHADGRLAAIVAEVNNTFGERHCYLLSGPDLAWGRELQARKVFHVSPFCAVQGRYRFRFLRTADRVVARIDHDDDHGPLLLTSVSGRLQPLTPGAVRRSFVSLPLLTLGVVLRIHWQALQLWLKRVPFFRKPEPPQAFITR